MQSVLSFDDRKSEVYDMNAMIIFVRRYKHTTAQMWYMSMKRRTKVYSQLSFDDRKTEVDEILYGGSSDYQCRRHRWRYMDSILRSMRTHHCAGDIPHGPGWRQLASSIQQSRQF